MSLLTMPAEIKALIWAFSLPEDEPEVCIAWPSFLDHDQQPQEPYLVDISFPVLMHICHETRQFILSPPTQYQHLMPSFRFSQNAGCRVPYRHFRPESDKFYIGFWQYEQMFQFWAFNRDILSQALHLAVDMSLWGSSHLWFPKLVFKYMQNIQTVSIVAPSSDASRYDFQTSSFQVPSRRCRVVKIERPNEVMGTMAKAHNVNQGLLRPPEYSWRQCEMSLREFVDHHWMSLGQHAEVQWHHVSNDDGVYGARNWYRGDAWNQETESFHGVAHDPFVFKQFKRGHDSEEMWEEVCQDRVFPDDYEPRRVEMRHDPTQWRVNDDELYPSLNG